MKDKIFNTRTILVSFFLFILMLVSGCGTMQSKYGMGPEEPEQFGHIYSGVRENIGTWCMLPHQNYLVKSITFITLVIDFPCSVVADTILVPVDLLLTPEYPRLTTEQLCEIHNSRIKSKSN